MNPILVALLSTMMFILGMVCYIGVPFLSDLAPDELREQVFWIYTGLASTAGRRASLARREHSGVDLVATKFDADYGQEYAKLDRKAKHLQDVDGRASSLADYPFGIFLEAENTVVDAVAAAIGERKAELRERQELFQTFQHEGSEFEAANAHAVIPDTAYGVDLDAAIELFGGVSDPGDSEFTEQIYKKSQSGFQSADVIQIMSYAMLFIAVLGGIWMAFEFAKGSGGNGGGGISLGLQITGVLFL